MQLDNVITEFRRLNRLKVLSKLLTVALFRLLLLAVALIVVEYFYHLSAAYRTLIFQSICISLPIGLLFLIQRYRVQTATFRADDRAICRLIEEQNGSVTVIWQLHDLYQLVEKNPGQDNSLALAAISEYTNKFAAECREPVLDKAFKQDIRRKIYASLTLLLLFTIPPVFRSSAYRLLHFQREFKAESSHSLQIIPPAGTIMESDSVRLNCTISGQEPATVRFFKKNPGEGKWSDLQLTPSNHTASFFIKNAEKDFLCYFASEETTSDTLLIKVTAYPRLTDMQLKIIPPAYTALPTEKLEKLTGDLTVYPGTRLDFTLIPDLPADSAIFSAENNGKKISRPFTKLEKGFQLSYPVRESSLFSFLFYTGSRTTPKPVRYRLNLLTDEFPAVKINFPQNEYQLGEENTVPLLASVSDDFEIAKAVAVFRKSSSESLLGDLKIAAKEQTYSVNLILDKQAPGAYLIQTELPLDKLQLLNGESAELYLQVWDNDNVSGPKMSKSQSVFIKMPTLEELFKTTDESYKEQKTETAKQLEKSKDLREKIRQLSNDLKSNNQQNWNDKAKLDQAMTGQQEMLKEMEKLEESIKANMENLEKNSLLSKETMDKYRRLQKMVDELFSEEMKNKLEKLNELAAKDKVGKDDLNKILDGLDEQQKKFQEGLEKTMQILEQIQTEYQLDKLLKTFNDLIEKQENINQSLKNSDSPADILKNREKELEKRYDSAVKDLQAMSKSENKLLKKISEEIKKTTDEFKAQNINADMQKQQSETGAQQNKEAAKTGNQIKDKLSDQADKLQDLKDSFNQQQKNELDNQIAAAAGRVLSLSLMTEELKNLAYHITAKSALGKEILTGYADLKNSITQTAENIFTIARQTFFIDAKVGAALGRINQKLPVIKTILESRNFTQGAAEQVYLMADLNELFLLLNEARDNLKNAESASGLAEMLKKMEELAKKQAELNEKSQGMQGGEGGGNPMPGMGGSPGGAGQGSSGSGESMSDLMSRLAKEQAAIQDALNQLMGENGMQPGGQGKGNQPGSGQGGSQPGNKGKGGKGGQGSDGEEGDGEGSRDNAGKLGKKLGGMSQSAQEIINEMQNKKMTESILKKQDTLLKHMLETVNSLRQERFSDKRESEGGKKSAVNPGKINLEEAGQTLREKMIRSLKEGYTREYQQKIREYYKELEK